MKNLNVAQNVQKGFTLIELMIVVAIIGILAALAIPAYQDYTIRSKVGETASLSGAAKTAVDIYYSENGTLWSTAPGHSTLGIAQSNEYKGNYVSTVAVGNNGLVTITIGSAASTKLPADVAGQSVVYEPTKQGGNLSWVVCNTAGSNCTNGTSTVTNKYLPKH